jgi:hypothetical protein
MKNEIHRLLDAGKLEVGTALYHPQRGGRPAVDARIVGDGIEVKGTVYPSLSTAAKEVAGYACNGWFFWRLRSSNAYVDRVRKAG